MTMKKYLLLFLSLVFVISITNAKIVSDSIYQIPKTTIAPVIDGVEDAVWKTLDWNLQRIYNVGDPPTEASAADSGAGLSGMSKAMWDENNLYVLFYTVDDVITEIPGNPNWNQDAIEIYVDGDNSKIPDGVSPDPGGGLAPGDLQMTIAHIFKGVEADTVDGTGLPADAQAGVEFIIRDVEDTEGFPGFMVEVKIPLANCGIDGASAADQLIGWDLQQDEADDAAAGRASMSKWWSNSNNSWTDASIWGTAILSSRTVDSTLEIVKRDPAKSITVDGVMDEAYKDAYQVTTNLFRVGDPPGTDAADTDPIFGGLITAYPLWDADNYYVFFDVNDAQITEIPGNPNWNQDAVEFYIDGDNSKIADGVSPDPGGGLAPGDLQGTFSHIFKGVEADTLDGTGLPEAVQASTSFVITDKPEGGYYVEVKFAMADVGIDATVGTEIGFEVQLDNSNDATAGRQGMEKWWHNSNNSWTDASLWGTAKLGPGATSVSGKDPGVVSNFRLSQNYPNPFNPSTTIKYTVAKSGLVKLNVYNLLGKEVATLVNEVKSAGEYTARFNATNLASGVYFYKLQSGNTVLTNKMVFLK